MSSVNTGLASKKADTSWSQGNPRNILRLNPLSCKKPKESGRFYLNVYFSEGEEDRTMGNDRDFKYFKMTYLNAYENECKLHLTGETIKEEDEDLECFDEDFKEALRIK